jgi:DNA sulfur modification protein DndD
MIGQFANQARSLAVRETDFYEQMKQKTQAYQKHDAVINNAIDQRDDLEKFADKEKVNSIKIKLSTAKNALSRLRNDIINAKTECSRINDKVKYLENQRKEIRKTYSKNKQNMVYLEYAKVIWEQLKTTYDEKEEEVRLELEARINKIFENIYDGGIQISVDERYNIITNIVTDSGDYMSDLEKNTAQSYAIIFAFIAGIIEMAKNNNKDETNDGFPLVMDAPLSAFDKERIKRICTVLPTIAEQVIIFIKDTDGDIAEKYMDSIIGKKWLIKKHSKTVSSLEER